MPVERTKEEADETRRKVMLFWLKRIKARLIERWEDSEPGSWESEHYDRACLLIDRIELE